MLVSFHWVMKMNGQIFPPMETGMEWLYISGPEAGLHSGDDDHLQTVYLLIPDSISDPFRIEILLKENDPESSKLEESGPYSFEFRMFGKENLYLPRDYNKYQSDIADYSFKFSAKKAVKLKSESFHPSQGEYRPELKSWLFRIELEGTEGSDSLYYKLKLHPENIFNSLPDRKYFYANNISFVLPEVLNYCFFIPDSAAGLSFEFFDMDNEGEIFFTSNRRAGQKAFPSGNGEYRRAMLNIFSDEKNDSLCLHIRNKENTNNNISIYWLMEDAKGKDISMPFEYSVIPLRKKKNYR